MDSSLQGYFHKKLIYKSDPKLDYIFKQYFKMMFPNKNTHIDKQKLLSEIEAVSFINFTYRTALISNSKDIYSNESKQLEQDALIDGNIKQIKQLRQQLKNIQKAKENKNKYNQLGAQLQEYDKNDEFYRKIGILQAEMQKKENQYAEYNQKYEQQKKRLKVSLESLRSFIANAPISTIATNTLIAKQPASTFSVQKILVNKSSKGKLNGSILENKKSNN